MRIQRPTITQISSLKGDGAILTGSFSGSFTGEYNTDILSSSAQIAALGAGILSGSAQIATDVSGSFTDTSASIASDIATNLTNIGSNDTDIAGLNTYTGSLKTAISVSGANTTLLGNLTVQGTQTALDTATLNVADLNILVASGAADSAAANGAGLTVDGASATFTYSSEGDRWNMNKALDIGSNTFDAGTVNTGQGDNELYAMNQAVQTTDDVQFDSFGVGTAASGTTGEIRATGDITAYYSSDERLKENFKTLDGALDKVNQLNGYEFDWKDGIEDVVSKKGHDIGVKAQEVQALYPELVHERDNGYLAVDYVKLTAVLLQAVKELSAKVDELSK